MVLLLLFSASFQRASSHPICEFILRTDKAGFRVAVTPHEWQKRQWKVVSGVKRKSSAADQKRAHPMLLGIKAVERTTGSLADRAIELVPAMATERSEGWSVGRRRRDGRGRVGWWVALG